MVRGERCDRGRANAGQRNRIHHRQRPAVLTVKQDQRSLNRRLPMPDRIARQVHVRLDRHEEAAIVFDRRQFGVKAPAWKRETARCRPSTLSSFVSTKGSGDRVDAVTHRQVSCDIARTEDDRLRVHRRAVRPAHWFIWLATVTLIVYCETIVTPIMIGERNI